MEQYISKSDLVAEIEKLKGKVSDGSSYCNGWQHALRMLELSLDAFKVKEVNLEKESLTLKDIGTINQYEERYKAILSRFKAQKGE